MKLISCLLFLGFLTNASLAATAPLPAQAGEDIVIGKSYKIVSETLGEDREIMVSLPEGYGQSDDPYPVIYMLEGQWYFPYAASLEARITPHNYILPSIIVAIKMANPSRFGWLNPGLEKSDRFMDFLEKELMPFVADNFRTTDSRTLMGWEYGGAFTLKVLSQRPQLFDAYIAASPFPVNEHNTDFDALRQLVAAEPDTEKYLYFGVSDSERSVNEGMARLTDILKESAPDALTWQHRIFTGGNLVTSHITSAYPVFRAGLSGYYADYRPIRPKNAKEFRAMGGVSYAKQHYAMRGQKYGLSDTIESKAVWWLMRIAMEGDDLALMEELMATVDVFEDPWNPYWYARYANFLYDQGKHKVGLEMLEKAVDLSPSSLRAVAGLADLYVKAGATSNAVATYSVAVRLAEEQSSDRLGDLKSKLEALQ